MPVVALALNPSNDAAQHLALRAIQSIELTRRKGRAGQAVENRRRDDGIKQLESQVHCNLAI